MRFLKDVLDRHVGSGAAPGAVALVARDGETEVQASGFVDVDESAPMARDSIFRVASLTKPITAAAAMMLVDEDRLGLADSVEPWLPELADRWVVRKPSGPADDVGPANRPITVEDLLTFRAGYGFPDEFSYPAVGLLFSEPLQGPPQPQRVAAPDEWMASLSRIPLLFQPGEAWLYNTCSDILGVLIARVSGQSLPDFLSERLFEPLQMGDTGFEVSLDKRPRFTSEYRPIDTGLELVDSPDGQWSNRPAFPSGAGGLVSTVDDWLAFAQLLLAGGTLDGRRLLSPESVRQMTTDHLTKAQRDGGQLFLEGQGWGFGGSVDVVAQDPWNVPGRYGWIGGTGTAAHIIPSSNTVTILLTQLELTGPTPPEVMRDFWNYAQNPGSVDQKLNH